ncbi:matrixin family metalloprotease [Secundilactobacillus oryzae]|uniref:matrixin family metalloprotease n=1 Tax=Secundilactobacillus oryzae TaxID=1202668 RepID=UPI000B1648F8
MRNTAIHELGHAVGMLHNAKKPSIMYPFVSNQLNISSGDVSSLYKTYKNISY